MKSPYVEIVEEDQQLQSTGMTVAKYVGVLGSMAVIGVVAMASINSNTPVGDSSKAHSSTSYSSTSLASTTSSNSKPMVPVYSSLPEDDKLKMFDDFCNNYSRSYDTETEKKEKYENFGAFLELVDQRNTLEKKGPNGEHLGAVHGITKFADWGAAEFKASFLGYRASEVADDSMHVPAKVAKYAGSSTHVNWAGTYTTDVKNQGYCGSCWAFSATSQIESDAIRQGLSTTSDELSPQQIVSCDDKDYGCSGGNTETAYRYVKRNGGLATSTAYPYTSYYGHTGTCSSSESSSPSITVHSYSTLDDEDAMQDYVLGTGPLSVCLDASSWSSYSSGIVSTCGTSIDHCVQAVGINTVENYWIVRNSWGDDWGIGGYIYLELGSDMCGISNDPTYTTVKAASR